MLLVDFELSANETVFTGAVEAAAAGALRLGAGAYSSMVFSDSLNSTPASALDTFDLVTVLASLARRIDSNAERTGLIAAFRTL